MFTDASFINTRKLATWAIWAKYNGNTIRFSGVLKQQINQISTAELSAIANGIFCIKKHLNPPAGAKIICQTDSVESIYSIQNHKTKRNYRPEDKLIVDYIHNLLNQANYKIILRHVKAHRGTVTPRNAVNTWCDNECRRQMQKALENTNNNFLKPARSTPEPELVDG